MPRLLSSFLLNTIDALIVENYPSVFFTAFTSDSHDDPTSSMGDEGVGSRHSPELCCCPSSKNWSTDFQFQFLFLTTYRDDALG